MPSSPKLNTALISISPLSSGVLAFETALFSPLPFDDVPVSGSSEGSAKNSRVRSSRLGSWNLRSAVEIVAITVDGQLDMDDGEGKEEGKKVVPAWNDEKIGWHSLTARRRVVKVGLGIDEAGGLCTSQSLRHGVCNESPKEALDPRDTGS